MINNKDLEPDVMAWHEGMGPWLPIGEIPLFEDQFKEEEEEIETDIVEIESVPPPSASASFQPENIKAHMESLHAQQHPSGRKRSFTAEGEPVESLYDGEPGVFLWRRFFARLLDTSLLTFAVLLVTILFQKQNPLHFVLSQQGQVTTAVLFTLYDTLFLYAFGTSIGKALLGIRIESFTGHNLGLFRSLIRAVVVTLVITATGAPLLSLFILVMCILFAKMRNRLPWDLYASSSTRALPLTGMRVISAIIAFIVAAILVGSFTPPDIQEDMQRTLQEISERHQK